jgi:hypothetical protein
MSRGKIKNKNKKPTENSYYFFVAHVDQTGDVIPLLLTDIEFEKAKKRAEKNSEDVPENFLVFFQKHKENKT